MGHLLRWGIGAVLVLAMPACDKKPATGAAPGSSPAKALVPASRPGMPAGHPAVPEGHPPMGGKKAAGIVVPEKVKADWSGVVLVLEDKTTKKKQELKLDLGAESRLPGSDLRLKAGAFLPDFTMRGGTVTSLTEQPNNPAVQLEVRRGEELVFKGWLFSRFPAVHAFEHARYGIVLKEGVKR